MKKQPTIEPLWDETLPRRPATLAEEAHAYRLAQAARLLASPTVNVDGEAYLEVLMKDGSTKLIPVSALEEMGE